MSGSPDEKGDRPTEGTARATTDDVSEKGDTRYERKTEHVAPGASEGEATEKCKETAGEGVDKQGNGKEEEDHHAETDDHYDDSDTDTDHDNDADSSNSQPDRRSDDGQPPVSRTSTSRSRALSIIPRSARRGLFARLAFIPEVGRPYDYENGTKWVITATIALAGAAGPFGSSIFYPALSQMTEDLNTTPAITNLSIAMYMLAMSIFPLWWATFSEEFGRRSIYVVSFTLFVIFSVLSAVSPTISMLIVMRLLGGGASASVQAVGAGTIADIWEVSERGRAMGIFYLGPLVGPLLAPFIGGALAQGLEWRSTMWFVAIYGAVTLAAIVFVLPETLANRRRRGGGGGDGGAALGRTTTAASTTSTISVHAKRTAAFVRRFFLNPLGVIAMLRFPAVSLTVFWASITFGALFVLNISIQNAYSSEPYAFSMLIIGLLYIPPSLGYILTSVFGGRWIDHIMIRQAKRAGRYDAAGKLVFLPEDRFAENAWLAAVMYPLALIFYGWTIDKGLHWAVPSVGAFFFGLASMLVFSLATTALTEFMAGRGAEAVAVNNFVRNLFSCTGAIVAQPIISALGDGWTFTILGLATLFLGPFSVWMIRRYSKRWRKSMDEALSRERR